MMAMRPGATQTFATSTTAAPSPNAISGGVTTVRVVCTGGNTYLRFSGGGTAAVNTDLMIVPNIPEYFIVPPNCKMSALGVGAGTVSMTEMSG